MKRILLIIVLLTITTLLQAQDWKKIADKGREAHKKGDAAAALKLYEETLVKAGDINRINDAKLGIVLMNVAIAHAQLGNLNNSVTSVDTFLAWSQKHKQANTSMFLEGCYMKYKLAIELKRPDLSSSLLSLLEGLDLSAIQIDQPLQLFQTFSSLGGLAYTRNAYSLSIKLNERAHFIYTNLLTKEDKVGEGVSGSLDYLYSDLGWGNFRVGNFEASAKYFSEAASYHRLNEDSVKLIGNLYGAGSAFLHGSQYAQAEIAYTELIPIAEKKLPKNDPFMGSIYLGMGNLANARGRTTQAIEYYSQSLTIKEKTAGPDDPQLINIVSTLAQFYQQYEDYPHAIKMLKRSIRIMENSGQSDQTTLSLNQLKLAQCYAKLSMYDSANVLLNLAETSIHLTDPSSTYYLQNLVTIGQTYVLIKSYKKAEDVFTKALLTAKPNTIIYTEASEQLGNIYASKKDQKKAAQFYIQALRSSVQEVIDQFYFLSDQERSELVKSKRSFWIKFQQYAFTSQDQNIVKSSLALAEFTRNLSLRSLKNIKQKIYATKSDSIIARYQRHVNDKNKAALIVLTTVNNPNFISFGFNATQRRMEDYEKELSRTFDENLRFDESVFDQVVKSLRIGEAFVQIIRANNQYNALILTNKGLGSRVTFTLSAEELESRYYARYYNMMMKGVIDRDSYRDFFQPVEQALNKLAISKFYLIPDGVFSRISPATLFDPATDQYLVNRLQYQTLTSATELLTTHAQIKFTSALLIGRPAYDISESNKAHPFMDLPGTETEVKQINEILLSQGIKTKVFLGIDATKGKLSASPAPEIIHLASHGFYEPESLSKKIEGKNSLQYSSSEKIITRNEATLMSGIAMAGSNDLFDSQNVTNVMMKYTEYGFLTPLEISSMDLETTQLVILSACQTGLGDINTFEGLHGLQRAFKLAGARFLVVSLWPVKDEATQKFMVAFYKNLLTPEVALHAAFKKTQQDMMVKYPNPSDWGAFVLIGN